MSEPETPADKSTIACGLLTVVMGIFLVLQNSGLLSAAVVLPTDPPPWLGACAGVVFVAGGIAVVLQSLPSAKMAHGAFLADTPLWVRSTILALSLTIVGGLACIGGWIAFGPGQRKFHVVGLVLGNDKVD